MITAKQAGKYLEEYIRRYRLEYGRFTATPPEGGGYPRLKVSPYISEGVLECHLAADGAVVLDTSEPPYEWQVIGGTAFISAPDGIPVNIWHGNLGNPFQTYSGEVEGLTLHVFQYKYQSRELILRLTYGLLELIIDLKKQETDSEFMNPRIISKLGYMQ